MWRFLNRFRAMITGFSNQFLVLRIVLHCEFFTKSNTSISLILDFSLWFEILSKKATWYGPLDMTHMIWSISYGPYFPKILIIRSQNDHAYNFTIKIDEFWIKNFDVLKLWAFNALQEWKMSETKLNCHNLY